MRIARSFCQKTDCMAVKFLDGSNSVWIFYIQIRTKFHFSAHPYQAVKLKVVNVTFSPLDKVHGCNRQTERQTDKCTELQ